MAQFEPWLQSASTGCGSMPVARRLNARRGEFEAHLLQFDQLASQIESLAESGSNGRPTVSIEYAHIYSDEEPNDEHRRSTEAACLLADVFHEAGWKVSLEVLIDDYNVEQSVLDVTDFQAFLANAGLAPDLIASEIALVPLAITTIEQAVPGAKSACSFLDRTGKVPCSALIAIWYAVRLGKLTAPANLYLRGDVTERDRSAPGLLIGVLPEKYSDVERSARSLTKGLVGSDGLRRIAPMFIADLSDPSMSAGTSSIGD